MYVLLVICTCMILFKPLGIPILIDVSFHSCLCILKFVGLCDDFGNDGFQSIQFVSIPNCSYFIIIMFHFLVVMFKSVL